MAGFGICSSVTRL